jgi:hypothetical protein
MNVHGFSESVPGMSGTTLFSAVTEPLCGPVPLRWTHQRFDTLQFPLHCPHSAARSPASEAPKTI